MSKFSIYPINGTLSNTTAPGPIGPGNDASEGVLYIPQTPALLEAHHHIQDTFWVGVGYLTPL